MVGGLFLLIQPAPAVALLMDPAFIALRPQLVLTGFGPVGRVGPDGAPRILLVEEIVEGLAVVHAGVMTPWFLHTYAANCAGTL